MVCERRGRTSRQILALVDAQDKERRPHLDADRTPEVGFDVVLCGIWRLEVLHIKTLV